MFTKRTIYYLEVFLFITFSILSYVNSMLVSHDITVFNYIMRGGIGLSLLLLLTLNSRLYSILFIILAIIMGVGCSEWIKYLFFPTGLYVGYRLALKYRTTIRKFFLLILFLNGIFIFIEINGLIPALAKVQIYYQPSAYREAIFVENAWFPLFQRRPSGIYQSTIFLTFEILFIFSIYLYPLKKSIISICAIAFVSIFSGSTALFLSLFLFLAVASKINNFKTYLILLAIQSSLIVSYYFLYPSFFSYNFNYGNYLGSFLGRFDFSKSNSAITANKYLMLGIFPFALFISISVLALNRFRLRVRYLYIGVVVLTTLTIHDFLLNVKFYVNVGLLLGSIMDFHKGDERFRIRRDNIGVQLKKINFCM